MATEKNIDELIDIVEMGERSFSLDEIEMLANNKRIQRAFEIKNNGHLYSTILLSLTHETFEEAESKKLWDNILEHLTLLNKKVDRNVGIAVAALDYLLNIKKALSNPKIIEESKSNIITTASTIDELTELYLRDIFDIVLPKEWDDARRRNTSMCLLMIDIDDFKQVNDKFGHQTGDDVLKKIGQTINQLVREMDWAVRYGGEELAVLMPHTDLDEAKKVANRILTSIERLKFEDFQVTVSIGLSENNHNICNHKEFIKAADKALYQAKKAGKNQIKNTSE